MPAPMLCRHGHAPNTTQQSERPLDACVCCNLHMCVLGAPVKSSKAHTPPPAPLGTAQPQMYKRVLYTVGPHAGSEAPYVHDLQSSDLQSTSAGCMRYDVRAVRTPWSCGGAAWPAWRRRPEQAAVYGRVGSERLRRCRGTQPACAEAHSRRQRVSNALRGCARPERSAPSCGIHTALGGPRGTAGGGSHRRTRTFRVPCCATVAQHIVLFCLCGVLRNSHAEPLSNRK